jgi:hypothetical protein
MLSLLLITALAVQTPQAATKPAKDSTRAATRRSTTTAPRGTSFSSTARQAFHDRMRELWSDHIVYTRDFIVSEVAAAADTAEVLQRLLRNQDELGEAIKPYYGDAAGSQLASLLRNHIQLAGKALLAAKGTTTAMGGAGMTGMNMQDTAGQSMSSRQGDTISSARNDTTQINRPNSQYPTATGRLNDTTRAKQGTVRNDTTAAKQNSQYPTTAGRTSDTTKARRETPTSTYGNTRTDTTNKSTATVYAQGQTQSQYGQSQSVQAGQTDSTNLNEAIAALKANGDSIADFLSKANPRGFNQETLRSAIQMHLTLLLKEATAQVKKDWSGSISAFDESLRQAQQMADMLSDGIMKQFPSRFSNKATAVSSR